MLDLAAATEIREKFFERNDVGEDDKKSPDFYSNLINALKLQNIKSEKKLAFIVVAHAVHTLPPFIEFLARFGKIGAIIPKSSHCVPGVVEAQRALYGDSFRNDIARASLQKFPPF